MRPHGKWGEQMTDEAKRLQEVLARIASLARDAMDGDDQEYQGAESEPALTCTPKSLPKRLAVDAAKTAQTINPVNAPAFGQFVEGTSGLVLDPQRIAVLTAKYWGPTPRRLTVSFVEPTRPDLRAKIVSHMNAWTRTACVSFVETQGVGHVRISLLGSGYWSYLGTDILHIPTNRPTMNLQGFSLSTSDGEYKRVVRHETGHTLGFPHEHMRRALVAQIDKQKAYAYFMRTQGWTSAEVDAQVLTSLDERSLMSTPPDQTSIMCYPLPGSITRNGKPILGGTDINPTDFGFAGKIYPRPGSALGPETHSPTGPTDVIPSQSDTWDSSEDVHDALQAAAG